ncbi:hypothetical protein L484_009078 [Morus notabilis]|uniref:Uncharacterized protein n=1 Tax=Morus notabilis TaxID=981085 RepID=W9R8B1_9ROSA|nr:hypothetical protein L484_009078 [Morus notabilis]
MRELQVKTWGRRSWVEKRMWAMSFKRSGEWEALIITWWAIVVSFRRLWRMSWAWIWRRWGREVEVFRRERILVVVLLRWGSGTGAICDLSTVCLFGVGSGEMGRRMFRLETGQLVQLPIVREKL